MGDSGVRHVFPNGSVQSFGPCSEARLRSGALPPAGAAENVGMAAHYPAPLYSRTKTADAVQRLTAKYIVPEVPREQADQSIYIWIGTDPDDESDVMQPVLGWNRVGGTDPSGQWYGDGGWGIESWNMVPSGHSTFSETIWGFQPGDIIEGVIEADSSIGSNGYYIAATGSIGGEPVQTVLRAAGAKLEHIPTVQFEVWNECLDSACAQVDCNRLPGSQVLVSDVVVEPASTFYSTTGLVWDLQQRCGWTKSLDQPSSGPVNWALIPPGTPSPAPTAPSPMPPSPSPSPTPSSKCPADAELVDGHECVWQSGAHGLTIPASAMPYCDYISQGTLGYTWNSAAGDFSCAASARKTVSDRTNYCLWDDGHRGVSIPQGSSADCGSLSEGRIGFVMLSGTAGISV